MVSVLEWVLVAEGDSGEGHATEEVDLDADIHRELEVECDTAVRVVDEEGQRRHEDDEPDDSK